MIDNETLKKLAEELVKSEDNNDSGLPVIPTREYKLAEGILKLLDELYEAKHGRFELLESSRDEAQQSRMTVNNLRKRILELEEIINQVWRVYWKCQGDTITEQCGEYHGYMLELLINALKDPAKER